MPAFVSDVSCTFVVKCVVRDMSHSGCRIATSAVRDLPDLVLLTPEGFKEPISAMIVWRLGKMAGLYFEHAADEEGRMRFENLRAARRREDPAAALADKIPRRTLSFRERLKRWSAAPPEKRQ
ncbi:MAG: hypothetical protein Kow0032_15000 [Methyloligellaceae bacterium]